MAWVFSDCFFTYTVSIITSVRSFFLSQVQAAGGVYAVYDLHQLVGVALVVLLEGMVVNSRRVSWAVTTTCCQTATLIVASVWSSHSLLLACCWTVHPGDDRASVAMRAYVDLLSHTAARLHILPAVTCGWFTIPPKEVIPQPRTKSLSSSFTASFRSSFTVLKPSASTS